MWVNFRCAFVLAHRTSKASGKAANIIYPYKRSKSQYGHDYGTHKLGQVVRNSGFCHHEVRNKHRRQITRITFRQKAQR